MQFCRQRQRAGDCVHSTRSLVSKQAKRVGVFLGEKFYAWRAWENRVKNQPCGVSDRPTRSAKKWVGIDKLKLTNCDTLGALDRSTPATCGDEGSSATCWAHASASDRVPRMGPSSGGRIHMLMNLEDHTNPGIPIDGNSTQARKYTDTNTTTIHI